MKSSLFIAKLGLVALSVTALAAAVLITPVQAQARKGGLYVYHTRPIGKCPGLDWHVMLEPNGDLNGFVAWDRMRHMARLNGSIAKDGDFQMDAKEVGGTGRQAVVKGKAAGDYLTVAIMDSGTGCDNQVLQVPRFEGGLGGGGG